MAVMEGVKVEFVSFVECLAYIIEGIDPYYMMPELTYGNPTVRPGNLMVRSYVDFTTGSLIVHDLDGNEHWFDLGQCLAFVDRDGKTPYTLDGATILIQTANRDRFSIQFEGNVNGNN